MWSFGDVTSGVGRDAFVGFGSLDSPGVVPVTFTPGFDASRSADKTEFSAPGTQTLTITLTPREATERFNIVIHADENDSVNPVITSPTSGDGIELKRQGHSLHIDPAGLALNTTWTIAITIEVTPKVPEIEYKPHVSIMPNWSSEYYSGTTSGTARGDSFSYTSEAGTWTVSAEGDYVWNWAAVTSPTYAASLRHRSNSPPTLTSAGVSPPSGTPITDLQVTYVDDAPPSYVRVYIDGSAHDMGYIGFKGQGYADGALSSHTTALSSGRHTYYFEASDVRGLTTRFPEDGTLSIDVPIWNAVGIVIIIGLVTYFLIRRWRRRAA